MDMMERKTFGENGSIFLEATAGFEGVNGKAPTGKYYGFTSLSETVVASFTPIETNLYNFATGITIASFTIPAGVFVPLRCTTLTLTSGTIQLYKLP